MLRHSLMSPKEQKYEIFDAWSSAYAPPKRDEKVGGTDDIKYVSYSVKDGKPVITYE